MEMNVAEERRSALKAILVVCWLFLCCFGALLTSGQATGPQIELHGFIVSRSGETLTVRTVEAGDVLVVLNEITRVLTPAVRFRTKQRPVTALVPGIILKVRGMRENDGQLIARTVELADSDLVSGGTGLKAESAGNWAVSDSSRSASDESPGTAGDRVIAGEVLPVTPQQQIQNVQRRFADLSDYIVKGTVDVYFAAGSAAIAPHYKDKLFALAQRAAKLPGYLIQIEGFVTSVGTAPEKPELSQERSEAVVAYLEQIANVPLTHIAACGNRRTTSAQPKSASHDSTDDRRAEVKLLITRTGATPKNR
jgi:outer membrane protein OmpA-like peptidoglycan-associated protein